jgi:predicted O-linked N-acetylglucosamine transferase (SPINDLY family)
MDYIIGDPEVIPVGHEAFYAEKVVRLPDTFQVNDSKRVISERALSRAEARLPESGFVFCCFNNNYKITPDVFDAWMRLLKRVEGSVLWLLEDNPAAARNLRSEAKFRGVQAARLVFAARVLPPDHLARHRLADLFLDTLPCNAHTTASDALWSGLPLLTCRGNAFPGRVAASLLRAMDLPELITDNLTAYEALAVKLATTPDFLADIKSRLARNRTTHPLFDIDRFKRHIESAYITMYERYQLGEPPKSFWVQPQ